MRLLRTVAAFFGFGDPPPQGKSFCRHRWAVKGITTVHDGDSLETTYSVRCINCGAEEEHT